MKKKIGLFILLLFLFSACSSQTANLTPNIATSNVSTSTLEINQQKTQESTLEPDQLLSTATIEALGNDCKIIRYNLSPDKEWATTTCDNYKINNSDEASTTLKIVNLETFQKWVVSYYQLYGKNEKESVGEITDGTIFPLEWSSDGNYMHIGVMPQVYREYYYNRTAALFRLNLETGEIKELLGVGEIQVTFYDFSLSNDENKIAYIDLSGRPLELKISTLDGDQIQAKQLDSKFTSAGSIVWSQTNDSLIFLAVNFSGNNVLNTLYKWNTQTSELVELFRLPDMIGRLFFIVKWDENNNVVVLKNYHTEEFFGLNLTDGEIVSTSP